jgi:hypothetical protein
MGETRDTNRHTAILWLVAAALAFAAAGIRLAGDGAPNFGVAAGGLFCLVMGISTWFRGSR